MSAPEASVMTAGTSGSISSMGDPIEQGAEPLKVAGREFPDSSREDNGHDTGHAIPCYRRKGDLPVHRESPGVRGEYPCLQPHIK